MARAAAAQQDHRPRSVQQAADQLTLASRGAANIDALATTGRAAADGPAVEAMAASLGPEAAARYQLQTTAATKAYATYGSTKAASVAELHQMAATPIPDPSDPNYSTDLPVAQALRKAASDELTARTANPGQWAWGDVPKIGAGKNGRPGRDEAGKLRQPDPANVPGHHGRADAPGPFPGRRHLCRPYAGPSGERRHRQDGLADRPRFGGRPPRFRHDLGRARAAAGRLPAGGPARRRHAHLGQGPGRLRRLPARPASPASFSPPARL